MFYEAGRLSIGPALRAPSSEFSPKYNSQPAKPNDGAERPNKRSPVQMPRVS